MADTATLRRVVVHTLLEKVERDPYPSATMMTAVEEMMGPEDRDVYARILIDKIRADRFPSLSMINRVRALI